MTRSSTSAAVFALALAISTGCATTQPAARTQPFAAVAAPAAPAAPAAADVAALRTLQTVDSADMLAAQSARSTACYGRPCPTASTAADGK